MATLTTDADVLIGRPGKETAVSHMLPSLVKTQNSASDSYALGLLFPTIELLKWERLLILTASFTRPNTCRTSSFLEKQFFQRCN